MEISFKPFFFSQKILDQYCQWFNDSEVSKFLASSTPKTKKAIAKWIKEISNSDKFCYFLISLPDQKKYIGHAGLKNINLAKKQAEAGVVIGEKEFWRKGIGTKAVLKILNQAQKLGLKKIFAEVEKENSASVRLFTKLGFRPLPPKQKGSLYLVYEAGRPGRRI